MTVDVLSVVDPEVVGEILTLSRSEADERGVVRNFFLILNGYTIGSLGIIRDDHLSMYLYIPLGAGKIKTSTWVIDHHLMIDELVACGVEFQPASQEL